MKKGSYSIRLKPVIQNKLLSHLLSDCLLCGVSCSSESGNNIHYLCPSCYQDLDLMPLGTDILLHTPKLASQLITSHIDGLTVVSNYQWPFSTWLPALKFHHNLHYAKPMADLLSKQLLHLHWPKPDHTIAIPLHKSRRLHRGYNQSELLLEFLNPASTQPTPIQLRRSKNTQAQSELGRQKRLSNLNNAFACPNKLDDKIILLIDDVVTTGSTVNQAAKTLKQAGAAAVYIAAIALSEV